MITKKNLCFTFAIALCTPYAHGMFLKLARAARIMPSRVFSRSYADKPTHSDTQAYTQESRMARDLHIILGQQKISGEIDKLRNDAPPLKVGFFDTDERNLTTERVVAFSVLIGALHKVSVIDSALWGVFLKVGIDLTGNCVELATSFAHYRKIDNKKRILEFLQKKTKDGTQEYEQQLLCSSLVKNDVSDKKIVNRIMALEEKEKTEQPSKD